MGGKAFPGARYEKSWIFQPGVPPPEPPPSPGGALDVLSISAGNLTFDTSLDPQTITVTGDDSGDIATGSLAFSGDTSALYITAVDGVTVTYGSGVFGYWDPAVDGSFYFAMDNGQSKVFTFAPRYVDGTEQTMTVQVLRGDLTVDDTEVATTTYPDASLALAEAQPTLLGVWDATILGVVDSVSQPLAMVDVSSKGAPAFVYQRTGDVVADQWEVVDTDQPNPVLSKVLNTKRRTSSGNSVANIASPLSAKVRTMIVVGKGSPYPAGGLEGFAGLFGLQGDECSFESSNYTGPYGVYTTGYGSSGFYMTGATPPPADWTVLACTINASDQTTGAWATTLGGTLGDVAASLAVAACNTVRTSPRIGAGHFPDANANRDSYKYARIFLFSGELTTGQIQAIIDALAP